MSEAALSANSQHQPMQAMQQTQNNKAGTNAVADQLFRDYGVQNVLAAVTNLAAEFVKKELGALIDSMDMPQFMKDDAMKQINDIGNSYKSDAPQGAQSGVEQILGSSDKKGSGGGSSGGAASGGSSSGSSAGGSASGGSGAQSGDDAMKGVMDMVKQSMRESTESASKKGGGTGGNGNWLAILARALGQTAGKSLKSMVDLGKKMGSIDSKENPEAFAETQAEFQAQAQIFKMFQEAIGTMIKSIGEGMSSVARKQ